MILRFSGAMRHAIMALTAAALLPVAAWADGPGYTYVGVTYEWTDVKFGVDPSNDSDFNNGDFEGINFEASLGILSWLHIAGEYFDGDCNDCGTINDNPTDLDYSGYQVGLGYNQSLGFIADSWADTDFILRANYVDVELDNVDDDGYSVMAQIRSQVSERAEVQIGYQYQDLGDSINKVENRDLTVGLLYRVWDGIALSARAIVFDDDTGFDLGFRWYFGNLIFGDRDSIVR